MDYYSRPDDITNVPRQLTKPEVEYYVACSERNHDYGTAIYLGVGSIIALASSPYYHNPEASVAIGSLSLVAAVVLAGCGWIADKKCRSLEEKLPK